MKLQNSLTAVAVAMVCMASASAAVSPDEAKKLGTTLTYAGAEKGGNAAGTIPPYTGGLTTLPPGYKKGDPIRPDPFAGEKPLFSIDAKNLDKYADKLTEGTKGLMRKYPTFRVDVYPTHRTVSHPKQVADNTLKCAVTAKTSADGRSMEGCHAGIPFPIPQNGYEAMWNHLTRYEGNAFTMNYKALYVDSLGKPTLTTAGNAIADYPYWFSSDPAAPHVYRVKVAYKEPARRAGEGIMLQDPMDYATSGRRAWSYLPGQRRVRVSPSVNFDTPNPSTGGATTYDDSFIFLGSMERFNFKLLGKKEIYIPYNVYKMAYHSTTADLFKPNHLNPDFVRWELHRVWVIEATLAEGKRHIYSKRVFYLDEDSWAAMSSDQYDMRGQLYRAAYTFPTVSYDVPALMAQTNGQYDLVSGIYAVNFYFADTGGVKYIAPPPERDWSPDSLAGGGLR
ncbi:MAG: DUF1329 domain-containing protein [Rhodocyclaceae bacterium]|jgi:hypothetical protein|nr:DUF1329 domain-containing protein [Rhodocyclaceae bacterium]